MQNKIYFSDYTEPAEFFILFSILLSVISDQRLSLDAYIKKWRLICSFYYPFIIILSTESEYDKEELPFSQVDEVLFELSNADRLSIPTKLNK